MLNYSWMFNKDRTWTVCLKTDYERRTLVISDQGSWLLFPPLQASLQAKNSLHIDSRITIAEGDYDIEANELWLADALFVDGTDMRRDNHLGRYRSFFRWFRMYLLS